MKIWGGKTPLVEFEITVVRSKLKIKCKFQGLLK